MQWVYLKRGSTKILQLFYVDGADTDALKDITGAFV